ncbi:hypothetical protein BN1723_002304 [Verticillium longisporum]|uniref:Uncharacterized protein n=1 Tax=Verticillium longisporum TaxID=100787 RepID=A0A0G4L303_VERLO|nr:hypothetical protein BN1723_002304 [Verticillium longisporum]
MKFLAHLAVAATIFGAVNAGPVHGNQPAKDCKKKTGDHVVPWDAKYATGLIPAGLELCLAKHMGPYLLNPMYQGHPEHGHGSSGHGGSGHGGSGHGGVGLGTPGSNNGSLGASPGPGSTEGGLGAAAPLGGSCFGCIFTVAKEVPCIYTAIKNRDPSALLQCGIGKTDICECVDCLPAALSKYVQPWCSSSEGAGVAPTTELADDDFVANADDNVKAFLGLLSPAELEALKEKAQATNPPPPQTTDGGLTSPNPNGNGAGPELGCVLGSSCGGCCCVGLCVFNSCVGGCF